MSVIAPLPRQLDHLSRMRELAASGDARRLRIAARLSQAEIAEACGATASSVSRWESFDRIPRGKAARRYAAIIVRLADEAGR
jgi:DNA-binding transcriptional regulator YiaG